MKILLLLHSFITDQDVHGVGVIAYEIAKGLKKNHDVVVVDREYGGDYGIRRRGYRGIRQYTVSSPGYDNNILRDHEYQHDRILDELDKVFEQEHSFDVVHVHHLAHWPTATLSYFKKKKIPIVLSIHDTSYICPTINYFNRLENKTCSKETREGNPNNCAICLKSLGSYRFKVDQTLTWYRDNILQQRGDKYSSLIEEADTVIYPTSKCWDMYLQEGVTHHNAVKIPHFLDFPTPEPREEGGPVVFGYIGNIGFGKGVDLLLNAFRSMKNSNARLHLYGGMYDAEVKKMIDDSNDDRIEYKGTYSLETLPRIVSDTDVVVVPSVFPESFSLCSYAAVSNRTFAIVSEASYHKEFLLEGMNCSVFETGDINGLRDKMEEVLRLKNFRLPFQVKRSPLHEEYLAVYKQLVDRHSTSVECSLIYLAKERKDIDQLKQLKLKFKDIHVLFDPGKLQANELQSAVSKCWSRKASVRPGSDVKSAVLKSDTDVLVRTGQTDTDPKELAVAIRAIGDEWHRPGKGLTYLKRSFVESNPERLDEIL